jgi:hypothetical protein
VLCQALLVFIPTLADSKGKEHELSWTHHFRVFGVFHLKKNRSYNFARGESDYFVWVYRILNSHVGESRRGKREIS